MDEPNITEQNTAALAASAERLAAAADALEQVLTRLEASQESLHTKIDRIIAAIEENAPRDQHASADQQASPDARVSAVAQASTPGVPHPSPSGEGAIHNSSDVHQQLASLQRGSEQLRAHAAQSPRKTFSPLVSVLLSKNGVDDPATAVEAGTLDRALATLSLEQRIAVKAELARAGMIA